MTNHDVVRLPESNSKSICTTGLSPRYITEVGVENSEDTVLDVNVIEDTTPFSSPAKIFLPSESHFKEVTTQPLVVFVALLAAFVSTRLGVA